MTNGLKNFNGPIGLLALVVVLGISIALAPKTSLALSAAALSAWQLASWSRTRTKRVAHQAAIDRASDLIEHLNRQRVFPSVRTGVTLPQDEEVLLAAAASLCEPRTRTRSANSATKSGTSPAPLRLDRSNGFALARLRAIDEGELVVSPHRLVFVGSKQSTDLRLSELTKVEADADYLVLSRASQDFQIILRVADPAVWHAVIGVASRVPLIGRTLPDDVRLQPPRRPRAPRVQTSIKRASVGR